MDVNLDLIEIKNKNSSALFKGSKLIKLVLDDVTIITDNEIKYLSSGCYLMYPWVGRLKSDEKIKEIIKSEINYPFKDDNNYPLHGLFANSKRKVIELNDSSVTFTIDENFIIENKLENLPKILEVFTLSNNNLEIETIFKNNNEINYFGYGYHPYIGINNKKIDNLIMKSNIRIKCRLTKEYMPAVNDKNELIKDEVDLNEKIGDRFFDSLFYYEIDKNNKIAPYISITDPDLNRTVKVESSLDDNENNINLNYYQIYTPESRECLAVEPMTSPSNAFNIDYPNNLIKINPNEVRKGKFTISIE